MIQLRIAGQLTGGGMRWIVVGAMIGTCMSLVNGQLTLAAFLATVATILTVAAVVTGRFK